MLLGLTVNIGCESGQTIGVSLTTAATGMWRVVANYVVSVYGDDILQTQGFPLHCLVAQYSGHLKLSRNISHL